MSSNPRNPVLPIGNRRSSTSKPSYSELETRVSDLEKDLAEHKQRLTELRKAKSQKLVKREREFIQVGDPFSGRNDDLEKENRMLKAKISEQAALHQCDLAKVTASSATTAAAAQPRPKTSASCRACPVLEEQVINLGKLSTALTDELEVLKQANIAAEERNTQLLLDLTVKEARICEREERLRAELQVAWTGHYAEWMARMEAKVAELEAINRFLLGERERDNPYYRDSKPGGSGDGAGATGTAQ